MNGLQRVIDDVVAALSRNGVADGDGSVEGKNFSGCKSRMMLWFGVSTMLGPSESVKLDRAPSPSVSMPVDMTTGHSCNKRAAVRFVMLADGSRSGKVRKMGGGAPAV